MKNNTDKKLPYWPIDLALLLNIAVLVIDILVIVTAFSSSDYEFPFSYSMLPPRVIINILSVPLSIVFLVKYKKIGDFSGFKTAIVSLIIGGIKTQYAFTMAWLWLIWD